MSMKRRIAQPIIARPIVEELRKTFNLRTHLPLWACDKLISIIEHADDKALKRIANADIRFASQAATFELIRRQEKDN
jgi:hypothetical protein